MNKITGNDKRSLWGLRARLSSEKAGLWREKSQKNHIFIKNLKFMFDTML